ncbi:conserved hypothetical protein [Hahella chejuensis KCTC 2396]|uniref:Uncharacterized protein n=1 Tax=Hahella chejuensis (strain KCTC 2396) TaxID=349521 RepID=Q2SEK1_HAHCH|nr:hypothetical protein [Hahella chejuensis]ABC30923.1 conserved hypothetical protein [Hahella chejuensis KCTC 2396]
MAITSKKTGVIAIVAVIWLIVTSYIVYISLTTEAGSDRMRDMREFQHGVDFVRRADGKYVLIWSSSGSPLEPKEADGDEWIHDVYYSHIDPKNPQLDPVTLISAPLAQEPASSAINDDGHIMVTMEDAWNTENVLAQTFGLYDSDMSPIKAYQQVVYDGGHSGHVAAAGKRFVVFYSDEWVDGGGVDDLGSGDDVMMAVYDTHGELLHERHVAVGDRTRDWWPLAAGSDRRALLVWQRFVDGKSYARLMYRMYDPVSDKWVKGETELVKTQEYYTYDVQYIDAIDRFLVTGAYSNGGGFAFLIAADGSITARNTSLPPLVREAQPAIRTVNGKLLAVYPAAPDRLMVLSLTKTSISLEKRIPVDYRWSYIGTDGIFLDDGTVYFVSLSANGPKQLKVSVNLD